MFLYGSWYVIGWSRELGNTPLARRVLDEPIVIFRGSNGIVGALQDECPHRHLPLSLGKVSGENLQCGYHGMIFGRDGRCVAVPSQGFAPPKAKVKSYPVLEKHGWIWIWMGEEADADPGLIPDFHQLQHPSYASVGKTNHIRASYRLLTDNLLDLSHVGYVHTSTIGNAQMSEKAKLTVKRNESGVQVLRIVENVPPPPMYVKSGVLPPGKNIDRWQDITFIAPCFVIIHVGGAEAGSGALDGHTEHGLNLWVLNAMTPETANSTRYFWASVRQHALEDKAADKLFFEQTLEAFEEDGVILEAQQKVLDVRGDSWTIALRQDAGSIEARRVLDALITEERAKGKADVLAT